MTQSHPAQRNERSVPDGVRTEPIERRDALGMRARVQRFDWASTPLGPVAGWPPHLSVAVDIVLASGFAMVLHYGPEAIQIYNDACAPSLGPLHPAALGRPLFESFPETFAALEPLRRRVLAGETVTLENQTFPLHEADGFREATFTFSYAPLRDEHGAVAGVLVTAIDTTTQHAAERERARLHEALIAERERLSTLVLHAPTPLALTEGPEHRFTLVNNAYRRASDAASDPTGQTLDSAFPQLLVSGLHQRFDEVYTSGVPWDAQEMSLRFVRDPGDLPERWFNIRLDPVRDSSGQVFGILNSNVDVTEQVRARREVERLLAAADAARGQAERARGEAEAANRGKSEFLAIMSHELRTPLNAIDGYAELMELGIRGPITDAQRYDLARIRKSERHLLGLINGVLNFAQVEAGAVRYDTEEVVLDEILLSCEVLITPQVRMKGLHFRREACDPSIRVRADHEKAQQIVLNLLSNAVKFTEIGGNIVVRCARELTGDHAWARIEVTDTGIGIPASQLARIFEPFVQVDVQLTRTREGTGLGLSISRDLARGMGGELSVTSVWGEGSTFTLRLPLAT